MNGGHVYVVPGVDGLTKIGRSRRPELRIKQLARDDGARPDLAWVSESVVDYEQVEEDAHRHFAACRVRGEWFSCDHGEAVAVVTELVRRCEPAAAGEDMRSLSLRMSAELLDWLRKCANEDRRSVNNQLVWLVEQDRRARQRSAANV